MRKHQHKQKFSWYDTATYIMFEEDNRGYIYGIAEWFGCPNLDEMLDDQSDSVCWSWFKTEVERDKAYEEIV